MGILSEEVKIELMQQIEDAAEQLVESVIRNELPKIASQFIDVSDMSTDGKLLQHRLTGRLLHVKATWIE